MPILLLIVTGIAAFGLTLGNYISLTEATGVGAREFAILRGAGADPCATSAQAISASAPTLLNNGTSAAMTYSFTVGGTTYSSPTCLSATLNQSASVQVKTTYPCTLKVYGLNLSPNCQLVAQTTEVIQ